MPETQRATEPRMKADGTADRRFGAFSDERRAPLSAQRKGRRLTEEHKRNVGLGQTGSKHWNWQGGIARNEEWHKRHAATMSRYQKANRDIVNTNTHRYRARKRSVAGSHTTSEWREKCELLGDVCFYCGESKPLAREHKVPISRGGSNEIRNIVPSCGSCNSKKGTLTAAEYLARKAA